MSEPKHTDSPWEVTPDGYRIWSEAARRVVLTAATNNADRTEEARAVARLAAAAPDLLRELRHLLRILEPMEQNGGLSDALNGARAAIQKAGGGMSSDKDPITRMAPSPKCDRCGADAEWQIGSYIPFNIQPVYLCDEHISDARREAYRAQEMERHQALALPSPSARMKRGSLNPSLSWQHAKEGETSSAFCRRVGFRVGDRIEQLCALDGRDDNGILQASTDVYTILEMDAASGTACDVRVLNHGEGADYVSTVNMTVSGLRGPVPELGLVRGDVVRWPCARVAIQKAEGGE